MPKWPKARIRTGMRETSYMYGAAVMFNRNLFGKNIIIYPEDWKNKILLGSVEKLDILSLFQALKNNCLLERIIHFKSVNIGVRRIQFYFPTSPF